MLCNKADHMKQETVVLEIRNKVNKKPKENDSSERELIKQPQTLLSEKLENKVELVEVYEVRNRLLEEECSGHCVSVFGSE